MKQQIVVVGLGRFGTAVATALAADGHDVLGIDTDLNVVQHLSADLTHVVQADATDPDTLRRLGVRDFDGAVVAIGESLESSILTTMALRELGVRHITAKAREERHGQILQRIGVDRIVYPERDTGERLAHSWSARSVTDSLSVVEEFAVHRVTVPDSFAGRTLAAADLHRRYHVSIFLLARGPKVTVHPGPDEVLRQGDVLVVAGNDDDVERLFT